MALRAVSDSARPREPGRGDAIRRRAADADDCPRLDDEAEAADPGRTHARARADHPRTDLAHPGEAAPDHVDQRAARRAERDLRAAACRPRLRAGARPYRLGGIAEPLRHRGRQRLSVRFIAKHARDMVAAGPANRKRPLKSTVRATGLS